MDELTVKGVRLSIGGSVHDPTDPFGRLLSNVPAIAAEFESDLIRARTREGMQVAKAKGGLRGKQPKLAVAQQRHVMEIHRVPHGSTTIRRALKKTSVGSRCRVKRPCNGTARTTAQRKLFRWPSFPPASSLGTCRRTQNVHAWPLFYRNGFTRTTKSCRPPTSSASQTRAMSSPRSSTAPKATTRPPLIAPGTPSCSQRPWEEHLRGGSRRRRRNRRR